MLELAFVAELAVTSGMALAWDVTGVPMRRG